MSNKTAYPNLDKDLRKWGLNVVAVKGWQTRSAGWWRTFKPQGVVCHHTASANNGNAPSLPIVKNGRDGIPGPLAQFVLARDGTIYLLSGHLANHAGEGGPYRSIPKDSANSYMWGIEAENNGIGERWGEAQLNAYYRLCAALLELTTDRGVDYVIGHKEWAPGRKIDPTGINMNQFRQRVAQARKAGPAKNPKPDVPVSGTTGAIYTVKVGDTLHSLASDWRTTVKKIKKINSLKSDTLEPKMKLQVPKGKALPHKQPLKKDRVSLKKVQPGKHNADVLLVQKALRKEVGLDYSSGPGVFGPKTRVAYAKWQRECGYSGDDANGVPGKASLTKLGQKNNFKVTR